jgi:ABC-2 type transport system permease protein
MNGAEDGSRPVRPLSWAVRRELWENRSVYLAPPAVAGVFLAGFLLGLFRLPGSIRAASALGPMQQQEAVQQPYVVVSLVLMAVGLLVGVVYCLDALYGERRDRSILFWKSLPVSDLTTVLSKASIPLLVLPLVTFGVTVAAHLVMLLASSAVLAATGASAETPWRHVPFLEVSVASFAHVVAFHGLWYAPFYGWLLLASAWAKRAPVLWATLPLVAIGVVEKIAFDTSRFATALLDRVTGGGELSASAGPMTLDTMVPQPLGRLVTSPGLWIGFAVTAVFLFAAIRLRRSRGPI